jgi:CHRD domain/PEP-CTERM motif
MKCCLGGLLAALLVFSSGPVHATQIFFAHLDGPSERPLPVATPATGFVTVELNDAQNALRFNLNFTPLLAAQTASHIHGLGGPNDVAPVRIIPPTLPLGHLVNFDIAIPDPLPNQPALSRAAFVQGLHDGQTYFNVHSELHPGGEIRGQLQLVPEPGTLFLLGSGLAGLGIAWRRFPRR